MIDTNQDFIIEFKELVEKEKKDNPSIYGQVTRIDGNVLDISLKYPSNLVKNMPVEIDRVPAQIIDINLKNIRIQLSKKAKFKVKQTVSIQNIQKDIIIHKLQETLDNILHDKVNESNKDTLRVLFENFNPTFSDNYYLIDKLNKNQSIAVERSLQADKFHIIKGPPGTGKTHTIIEIIKQLHKRKKRILITTHTHIALDNIIERLDTIDERDILRLGQKSKVSDLASKYTLEEQIKKHPLYEVILEKESIIENLKNPSEIIQSNVVEKSSGVGIINKILKHLFSIEENEITLNNHINNTINSKNKEAILEISAEIENIKSNIQNDILKNVNIIASTVLSSSSFLTRDMEFDYVIMDEASQVPVYLALIPLMKTDKFILIGDDKQLQPIQNDNASYTLNKSVFNFLIDKYPDNYTFLNIQYRMNQEISDVASKLYYGGKLLTGDNVKKQKISLIKGGSPLINDDALTFIDTSNMGFNESSVSGGCCNKHESKIILSIVKSLIRNKISEDEIGVITPYKKQKLYLNKLFLEEDIHVECDTIYRFQGREKDVIIVSFCKSMNQSLTKFQKKFIADENQLNVSITRSRRKLILIGNYSMLVSADNIRDLVNEIPLMNRIYLEDIY